MLCHPFRPSTLFALTLLAAALGSSGAGGQPPPAAAAKAAPRLSDLAWMAGRWQGQTTQGLAVEETVSEPAAGVMMGMFRAMRGEQTLVLEFFSLRETPEGIEMRLRHFSPAMEPWEKGDAILLRLQSWDGSRAVFENPVHGEPKRTVITRTADDTMTSRSEIVDGKGGRTIELTLRRVR